MDEYSCYTTKQLAAYFSDYHKDLHGFRPHHIDMANRRAILEALDALDYYMDDMKSTPEGRAKMRDNGWWVEQED